MSLGVDLISHTLSPRHASQNVWFLKITSCVLFVSLCYYFAYHALSQSDEEDGTGVDRPQHEVQFAMSPEPEEVEQGAEPSILEGIR